MARLTWAGGASRDFGAICDWIAREGSQARSRKFARDVQTLAADVPARPYMGAEVPEYGRSDIRERLYKSYRLIYRVEPNGDVTVLMVVHGARMLPPRPPQ